MIVFKKHSILKLNIIIKMVYLVSSYNSYVFVTIINRTIVWNGSLYYYFGILFLLSTTFTRNVPLKKKKQRSHATQIISY